MSADGCCEPQVDGDELHNPPGRSELHFRVAPYGETMARVLAALPEAIVETVPGEVRAPLAALTTRSPDDPAIALVDAWASVADVLSFYQERLANEGFLRTATERRSILELARLIGYELNPGVAASAFLTYQVDTAPGAPRSVVVSAGSQVRSVPGQDELPQTFETVAEITARAEWNELRPRLMRPQHLAFTGSTLHLLGAGSAAIDATTLFSIDKDAPLPASGTVVAAPVDAVHVQGTSTNLRPGDVLLLAGLRPATGGTTTTGATAMVVQAIKVDDVANRTRVELQAPPSPAVHYAHIQTGLFGVATSAMIPMVASSVDSVVVGQAWKGDQLSTWMSVQGWNAASAVDYIAAVGRRRPAPAPGDPGLFALRATVGMFGHNAPAFGSLTDRAREPFLTWDGGLSIWKSSLRSNALPNNVPDYHDDADCFLERSVPVVVAGGWAVLESPGKQLSAYRVKGTSEASLAEFALSAKTTGLKLGAVADGADLDDDTTDKLETLKVRTTTAHVGSERLLLADLPAVEPFGVGTAEALSLTLDTMVLGLEVGQPIAVTGEDDQLPGVTTSEVVVVADVVHAGGFTTLAFVAPGFTHRYVRAGATLCANVAPATHGESVREVLGSASGAVANATFGLRKPPLTYTASADPSGAHSSLEVRVDGVAWAEAPRLYGVAPTDEVYVVRRADDGKVAVTFGDGVQGARLPTGVENVSATYRTGIGRVGMVPAGSLTMLMTRPLGIRAVDNPLAATGAADPEARDDARRNAPNTVLTIDRVVSQQDAEDYARAFAGIGKCTATGIGRRGVPWVHLTVAAAAPGADPGGAASAMADHRLAATAPLRANLIASLDAAKEPTMRIRVDTYQPAYFDVVARLLVDRRYRWDDVVTAATAALVATFGFERRSFVESVTVTDVVAIIQAIPGVVFVDLDALHRFDQPPALPPGGILVAAPVVWHEDDTAPSALAELLLVDPLGISFVPITAEGAA